ncbi:MAG: hypothetical protein FH756_18775 [Firmicutes bacterium]|nr:hypothetical protein [Bacillota bacterium]
MQVDMYPVLQNRWKLEGNAIKYYGLRNYPHTLQRIIKLSSAEISFLSSLDGKATLKELTELYCKRLV